MHPVCFKIGAFTVHWYGVFMALAFVAGLLNWIVIARREGRDAQFCSDLLFWVMIAGILGGRVAYVLSDIRYYLATPSRIIYLWEGGLIYYGGFFGAILAVVLFARRHNIPFLSLLDFSMTALPLAHALGRIGCFMNGCCFGDLCGAGPSLQFPMDSLPWWRQVSLGLIPETASHTLPVYPVQFYEAGLNVLLYVLLLVVYQRRRWDGVVTGVYLLAYPCGRFALELLRGTDRVLWLGVPVAQFLSIILFLTGGLLLLGTGLRHRAVRPGGAGLPPAGGRRTPFAERHR